MICYSHSLFVKIEFLCILSAATATVIIRASIVIGKLFWFILLRISLLWIFFIFFYLSGPELYQKPDVCHGCKYEGLSCEWLGSWKDQGSGSGSGVRVMLTHVSNKLRLWTVYWHNNTMHFMLHLSRGANVHTKCRMLTFVKLREGKNKSVLS